MSLAAWNAEQVGRDKAINQKKRKKKKKQKKKIKIIKKQSFNRTEIRLIEVKFAIKKPASKLAGDERMRG